MPLEKVIAGPYTATYNGVWIGMTRRGFELQWQTHGELINETDIYGDSLIDVVNRGTTIFCMTECRVFKAGSVLPFYPWNSGLGDISSTLFPIGGRASDYAKPFIMSVVLGTSAAGTTPPINTLTAPASILPPGSNLSLLFDSRARSVPLRQAFLPVTDGGFERAFSTA